MRLDFTVPRDTGRALELLARASGKTPEQYARGLLVEHCRESACGAAQFVRNVCSPEGARWTSADKIREMCTAWLRDQGHDGRTDVTEIGIALRNAGYPRRKVQGRVEWGVRMSVQGV